MSQSSSEEEEEEQLKQLCLAKIEERKDALGTYSKFKPGIKVRLPRQRTSDDVIFVTGTLKYWEESEICRGFTWDVDYQFEGEDESHCISVIIDRSVPGTSCEPYWTIAEEEELFSIQLVIPDMFYMSVSKAFEVDGAFPESERPLAY